MEDKEIIEELKSNKYMSFGAMGDRYRDKLHAFRLTGHLERATSNSSNKIVWVKHNSMLFDTNIYRLSPDYSPEPEEPCQEQIKNINKRLGDMENSRGKMSKTDTKKIWGSIRKTQQAVNGILDVLAHYNLKEGE